MKFIPALVLLIMLVTGTAQGHVLREDGEAICLNTQDVIDLGQEDGLVPLGEYVATQTVMDAFQVPEKFRPLEKIMTLVHPMDERGYIVLFHDDGCVSGFGTMDRNMILQIHNILESTAELE